MTESLPVDIQDRIYKAVRAYIQASLMGHGSDDTSSVQVNKSLKALLRKDEYLNNIPLAIWDSWASFLPPIKYVMDGQTWGLSLSEQVSLLKHIVREDIKSL